jgi:hypothetical protein
MSDFCFSLTANLQYAQDEVTLPVSHNSLTALRPKGILKSHGKMIDRLHCQLQRMRPCGRAADQLPNPSNLVSIRLKDGYN